MLGEGVAEDAASEGIGGDGLSGGDCVAGSGAGFGSADGREDAGGAFAGGVEV